MPKVANKHSALEAKIPLACADESAAVAFLESQRWGDTPNCPRCGDTDVSMMKAKDGSRNARFLWRCKGCKQQYTVRVGTIMEDSPIPFRHWCLAFYRAAASKKGVSALQIQRETGLTYKSALFLMHRIRWAMAPANELEPKLGIGGGTVEFDETYVGGEPRYAGRGKEVLPSGRRKMGPAVDFGDRKTPVVGGVERDGRVKARVVSNVTASELAKHVAAMVDTSAHLQTDHAIAYKTIGLEYASHERIRHNAGQYVRYTQEGEQVTTNRIEGFWAGLKRQIHGTHHSVSRKHLQRYVSEAEFKYNNRDLNDGERTVKLIQACDHRRLTYKELTAERDRRGRVLKRDELGRLCK
jgi:transposase-like protein